MRRDAGEEGGREFSSKMPHTMSNLPDIPRCPFLYAHLCFFTKPYWTAIFALWASPPKPPLHYRLNGFLLNQISQLFTGFQAKLGKLRMRESLGKIIHLANSFGVSRGATSCLERTVAWDFITLFFQKLVVPSPLIHTLKYFHHLLRFHRVIGLWRKKSACIKHGSFWISRFQYTDIF